MNLWQSQRWVVKMLQLKQDKDFVKDLQKARLNNTELGKFTLYVSTLLNGKALPQETRDHDLKGEWQGFREFHIGGNKLVIYKIESDTLKLARLGTHNQLFKNA